MRFNQFKEGALEDTKRIIQKTFSPERQEINNQVRALIRDANMGKGDKMELAQKLTALTKSELEAKSKDSDLSVGVDDNVGMMKRAMAKITGNVEEQIEESELTPELVEKIIRSKRGVGSLNNRNMFSKLPSNKPKEPKATEPVQLDLLDLLDDVQESLTEEQFDEAAGEKDACYRKVKSRYKVWPSAYASGALTKCRKVGAANWGNSKKK